MFLNFFQRYYYNIRILTTPRSSPGKRSRPNTASSTSMKKPKSGEGSAPSTPIQPPIASLVGCSPPLKNLKLLSNVATASPKRRRAAPNPVCTDKSHSKRGDRNIQRHSCKYCLRKRIDELIQNKNLHRWDIMRILMQEFRRYYCGFCMLVALETKNFDAISLGKQCTKGHSVISSMRRCEHGKLFKCCNKCKDPRNGGMYKACNCIKSRKCSCEIITLGEQPQHPAVLAEKEAWSLACLERATRLEAHIAQMPVVHQVLAPVPQANAYAAAANEQDTYAAEVLEQMRGVPEIETETDSDEESVDGTSSTFCSPAGSSSAASISVGALVEDPAEPSYETESDSDGWVINDGSDDE